MPAARAAAEHELAMAHNSANAKQINVDSGESQLWLTLGAVMAAEAGLQSAGARRKLGARPRQIATLLESSGLTSLVRRRKS